MRTLENIGIKPDPDFERLKNVLFRKKQSGRIPFYELYVNQGVMEALLGRKMQNRADTLEFYYKAGYDYLPAWPRVPLKRGSLVDTSLGYPISDWKSFKEYVWPRREEVDLSEFEELRSVLPSGMKIIGQIGGIFECLEYLCGYENLCCMLYDERDLVTEILDRIEEVYVWMYEGMAAFSEVGALVVSDDMGFKTQTLIAPEDLRKLILPGHKRLAGIAHGAGKPCILHSCGNLKDIMEDIISFVGIDAKHSYEDEIMPVAEAKSLYGDRIGILGGFDVDRLCRESGDNIKKHTEFLLETCGAGGGYALGSGNSIADYVPLENYLIMLETGWHFNK